MLKVPNISIPLDNETAARGGSEVRSGFLVDAAAQRLGIDAGQIKQVRVARRSVDARKKSDVHFVVNAAVELVDPSSEQRLVERGATVCRPYEPLQVQPWRSVVGPGAYGGDSSTSLGEDASAHAGGGSHGRPVVVGTGPAGLFAALYLARAGACPLVIERGARVDRRAEDVRMLNEEGLLNPHSNIQFGEGGAGTFSDGKLTTNIKSPFAAHVLRWFADAGAPEEILWQAKPHIGSDLLPAVVASMRNEIIERGGEVLFDTLLSDRLFEGGSLAEAEISPATTGREGALDGKARRIRCTQLVLACGHSARGTFALLQDRGVHLEQKPFSVGVRIEHRQEAINQAQWGDFACHPALEAADYKLAVHECAGRSVYTFCMCPGGEVVCAASEAGGVATNGASPFARDGRFANSALLVNVVPSDFDGPDRNSADPLAGVRFQRAIEQRAFDASCKAGGHPYQLPAQTVAAFLAGNSARQGEAPAHLPETSTVRGAVPCDLRSLLPAFVCDAIAEALPKFDRMLAGFGAPDSVLIAPETRSTSPVRIARNDRLQAWLEDSSRDAGCGIYPAGEGAGYAGGIMSAACDGLRVAQELVRAQS